MKTRQGAIQNEMDKKSLLPESSSAPPQLDPVGTNQSQPRLGRDHLLRRPFDVRSLSMTGLFILALFYTLYFMRSILLPIVLALLLSYAR
ncbi:MAG: hypothetical protein ABJB09_03360 [Verrucomicrobiota bacterium]